MTTDDIKDDPDYDGEYCCDDCEAQGRGHEQAGFYRSRFELYLCEECYQARIADLDAPIFA